MSRTKYGDRRNCPKAPLLRRVDSSVCHRILRPDMGDTGDALSLIENTAGCPMDYAALANPSSSHSSTLRLAWSARCWH